MIKTPKPKKPEEYKFLTPDIKPLDVSDYSYGKKNEKLDEKQSVRNTEQEYWTLKLTSNQSIGNGSWTALSGYTFTTNTNAKEAVYVSGTEINVAYTGMYMLDVGILFDTNSTGLRGLRIRVKDNSGGSTYYYETANPVTTINTAISKFIALPLEEGNKLYLQAVQTSGGSLNILSTYSYITFIRI